MDDADSGVAGAAVNTTQQVGGSVGIALLSTLAASAATSYLRARDATDPTVGAHATLHSYAVAYWIVAAVFAGGALLVSALYPGRSKLRPRHHHRRGRLLLDEATLS